MIEFKVNVEISSDVPVQMAAIVRIMKEIAQIGAGKSFGEKSIDENKPRAATVYVRSNVILVAELTRTDYIKVIGNSFKNQMD